MLVLDACDCEGYLVSIFVLRIFGKKFLNGDEWELKVFVAA
jgi:hypothetical protein